MDYICNIKDNEYIDILKQQYEIAVNGEDSDNQLVYRAFHAIVNMWLSVSFMKICKILITPNANIYFGNASMYNNVRLINFSPFFEEDEHGMLLKSKLIKKFIDNGFCVTVNNKGIIITLFEKE